MKAVPTTYNTISIAKTTIQPRAKLWPPSLMQQSAASATGNRKIAPCSIGTKMAGQRRISDLRRSRRNSAVVKKV